MHEELSFGKKILCTFYRLLVIVLFLFFVLMALISYRLSVNVPKKPKEEYNTTILIDDQIGMIEDTDRLRQTFQEFYDETGITPAFISVHNEDWEGRFTALSEYAPMLYHKNFKDQAHWLIVYTESEKNPQDYSTWETVEGEHTDSILHTDVLIAFRRDLHNLVRSKDYSFEECLILAFDHLPEDMMKITRENMFFLFVLLGTGIIIYGLFLCKSLWKMINQKIMTS